MLLVAASAADSALHLGALGFNVNETGAVTWVDPRIHGSVALGDRILIGELPPPERFKLGNSVREGSTFEHLPIERAGRPALVDVTALPADSSEFARTTRFIGVVVGCILVIGLASLVFMANPRVATLGFYFYALVMLVKTFQTSLNALIWPFDFIADLVVQVCYPLAQFLILLFATQIFTVTTRVSRFFLRSNATLGIAVFFIWSVPIVQNTFGASRMAGTEGWWAAVSDFLQIGVTLVGLGYVARVAPGSRGRIAIVVLGIALPALNDFTWSSASMLNTITGDRVALFGTVEDWTDVLQPWFAPVGVALVCYGLVLRHIVGFRSAVARAAVATLASVALLALFELLDWAVDRLSGEHAGDYSKIVALLASGFLLRMSHHRVDEFVKRVLFRRSLVEARELRHAAEALACTASRTTVRELLLAEPIRVLRLPAAALFLGGPGCAVFERWADAGDVQGAAWPQLVSAQGILVARLRAERRALRLGGNDPDLLTRGRFARAIALPFFQRGEISGVVLFADRVDDSPLDDNEIRRLKALGIAAAAALDHIDASEARATAVASEPELHLPLTAKDGSSAAEHTTA